MRPPKSGRVLLASALAFPLGFGGVVLVASQVVDEPEATPWAESTAGPTRAERLIERHDCWGDAGPPVPNTIPGHAIAQLTGERAKRHHADVGFDIWLGPDSTPGTGDERPGRLYAFCP